ncbi:MAG TPA: HAD family hydrolase [Planctomycetota bacterium]|nr:HAD family hydrolase [Planctomycetota bacterium]
MKLLTDFDGVLTDIAPEARRYRAAFEARLALLAPGGAAEVAEILGAAERACAEAPHAHGWRSGERISAFFDEDLFIRVHGLAARLDDDADRDVAGPRRLRAAAGGAFKRVATAAYAEAMAETASGAVRPLDPDAAPFLRATLDAGVDVTVVSNSSTERILALLRAAGLPAVAHGAGAGRLRVRGDARKFELGDDPRGFRALAAGAYEVAVDRPRYEAILRDKAPDAVMGDVFSLDLAAPLALRRDGAAGLDRVRLLLRRRPYTPAWALAFLAAEASGFWTPVDRLPDASAFLRRPSSAT